MELPKYFFAESPDLPGAGFMLATQRPCYLFKVLKFNKPEDFELFRVRSNNYEIVPGYMLAVQYFKTLGEDSEAEIDPDDLEVALKQAVDFYLEKKIEVNERYYRRNKI